VTILKRGVRPDPKDPRMTDVITLSINDSQQPAERALQDLAIDALERGAVLCLPQLPFPFGPAEQRLLSPELATDAKNISLAPGGQAPRGVSLDEEGQRTLHGVMQRYAGFSTALLRNLLPHYTGSLEPGRTSFRPLEIAGRTTSRRKDDTRLHVDSFPSSPTGGKRILRVFSNVNPRGDTRTWRLGEPFETVARRFLPGVSGPLPGASVLLRALGITKRRRTAYDHYMLRMHDRMKADLAYQASAAQNAHEFESGSTWIVYTDQTSHAAMRGQHALEQTFYLPVAGMKTPAHAPLRTLERLLGRPLA
jgi:hypothetical protein